MESASLFCPIEESVLYARDMKRKLTSIDLFSLVAIKSETSKELIPNDISFIYANPSHTFRFFRITVKALVGTAI